MTTQDSGNTIPSSSRAFQLTLNEVERWEKLKSYLESRKMLDYALACEEIAPTTGHKHIHCYVHFNEKTRLAMTKIQGSHVEVCRGSPKQNIEYIRKDGNVIWEFGEAPHQGKTIKDLKEMTREQRDELPIAMKRIVDKVNEEEAADIDINDLSKQVIVYWICGPSGIGKTEKAKQIIRLNSDHWGTKVNFVKYEGGFWHGIGSAKIAIYDDFRDSHMKPSEFIHFIDYNKHFMNVKNGSRLNEYKVIIITSVQHPNDIYSNVTGEPRLQWLRRMEIIEMVDEDSDIEI